MTAKTTFPASRIIIIVLEKIYLNGLPIGSSYNVTGPHACATNHIFTSSDYKVNLWEGENRRNLTNTLIWIKTSTCHIRRLSKMKYLYSRRLDLSQSFSCTKHGCRASHVKFHQFDAAAWPGLNVVATTGFIGKPKIRKITNCSTFMSTTRLS